MWELNDRSCELSGRVHVMQISCLSKGAMGPIAKMFPASKICWRSHTRSDSPANVRLTHCSMVVGFLVRLKPWLFHDTKPSSGRSE